MTALTRGIHHVGLTVPDLAETRSFFVELLGFEEVGGNTAYPAVFLSDGTIMLTLWQAAPGARPFDRRTCIGLHHLALTVDDAAALAALHDRLARAEGVAIEFAPEPLGSSGARHMMCVIPSGLRVELIAPSGS